MHDYELLQKALLNKETILLTARCTIDYNGRAQSYLPEGDRIILIKPDGTLLVHQISGSVPVNYMKEKTEYQLLRSEGILSLKARHPTGQEYMDIEITHIHHFTSLKLEDSCKIQLKGNEKDMSDMIFNNPELIEKGLKALSREEHTEFGFVDVLCKDISGNLVVVECKRYTADYKAVSQLQRYVEKIKESKGISNVRGVLASPTISDATKTILEENGFKHIALEPPKFKEKYKKDQKKLVEF